MNYIKNSFYSPARLSSCKNCCNVRTRIIILRTYTYTYATRNIAIFVIQITNIVQLW